MLALTVAEKYEMQPDLLAFSSIVRGLIETNVAAFPAQVRRALTSADLLKLLGLALKPMPTKYSTNYLVLLGHKKTF